MQKKKRRPYTYGSMRSGRMGSYGRGHPGRGDRGACGGTRRRDGSGQGVGNRGR